MVVESDTKVGFLCATMIIIWLHFSPVHHYSKTIRSTDHSAPVHRLYSPSASAVLRSLYLTPGSRIPHLIQLLSLASLLVSSYSPCVSSSGLQINSSHIIIA